MCKYFNYCFLFITFLIVGCSNEPSDIDVKQAIEQSIRMDVSNATKRKILGIDINSALGIGELKINTIEKIECKSEGKKSYYCNVLVDYEFLSPIGGLTDLIGGVPRYRKIGSYRLVNTSTGWIVAE